MICLSETGGGESVDINEPDNIQNPHLSEKCEDSLEYGKESLIETMASIKTETTYLRNNINFFLDDITELKVFEASKKVEGTFFNKMFQPKENFLNTIESIRKYIGNTEGMEVLLERLKTTYSVFSVPFIEKEILGISLKQDIYTYFLLHKELGKLHIWMNEGSVTKEIEESRKESIRLLRIHLLELKEKRLDETKRELGELFNRD